MASLGMIQCFQFNQVSFCRQTCRTESVVGSSFFKSWPRHPLVQELLVYYQGQRGMSGASRTVELEVPASRLVAPTSATLSTGCMASRKDIRESSVWVGVLLVCVSVYLTENTVAKARQHVHAAHMSSLINLY